MSTETIISPKGVRNGPLLRSAAKAGIPRGWSNVYQTPGGLLFGKPWPTKAKARARLCAPDAVACIPVRLENGIYERTGRGWERGDGGTSI